MDDVDLILTLTGGLAAALSCGYVTFRRGLSPIVGYLLAGFVVGPATPEQLDQERARIRSEFCEGPREPETSTDDRPCPTSGNGDHAMRSGMRGAAEGRSLDESSLKTSSLRAVSGDSRGVGVVAQGPEGPP